MPTFETTGPDGATYHIYASDEHAAADAFSTFTSGKPAAPPKTFDFTSPDGKKYSVQGPDGSTPEQAFQILQSQIGGSNTKLPPGFELDKAPDSNVSTLGDMAESAGIGLVKGAIGLAALPAEAAGFLGGTGSTANQDIQKGIESYTGPLYEPENHGGTICRDCR